MFPTLALVIPLVATAVLMPIYSDELVYKWFSGRYWLDHGISVGLFPQCSDQFTLRTPKLFLVTRLIDSWLYADLSNPLKIRYLGILNFLLWLTLLFVLCKHLFSEHASKQFNLCISIVFLGTLPLMMTLNRPEQPLILALTAASLLPLSKKPSHLKRIFLTISFAFLIAWFFPQHPKTLLFIPFFLVVCFFIPLGRITRFVLGVGIVAMAYSSYSFYSVYHACPANQNIEQLFSATLISPSMFAKMPWFYTKQIIRNFFSISKYFSAIGISQTTEAAWLPAIKVPFIASVLNIIVYSIMGSWLVAVFWSAIKKFRCREMLSNLDFGSSASLTLLLALFSTCLLQTTKSFYNCALLFPVLILSGILAEKNFRFPFIPLKFERILYRVVYGISLFSVCSIVNIYLPANLRDWKQGGPLDNQYNSFSGFNWAPVERRISRLAKECDLANEPSAKHLVLDDITYSSFTRVSEPYHANYVTGYWSVGIDDLETFLKQRKSAGLICQCKFLSKQMISKSQRDGELCCIPAFK